MGYVACGACATQIPSPDWNQEFPIPCPSCSCDVAVTVFPAALHPARPVLAEAVVTGQEASCYNHASNRAVAACDECGRFLCAVCDIETAGGHVCPACFDRKDAVTVHERVNFDSIALGLATLPMMLCWLPVITTPIALFLTFQFWNAPSPVMARGKWRLWLTLLVALVQIGLVVLFFVAVLPATKGLPRE